MTLRELRMRYVERFQSQDWFMWERFMDFHVQPLCGPLPEVGRRGVVPTDAEASLLPHAVDFVSWFITFPNDPMWGNFLWTRDTDVDGNRVYVGIGPSGYFEIHRHFQVSEKFALVHW